MLGVVATLAGIPGTSLAQQSAGLQRAALSAWDTGTSSAEPLTPETVEQKNAWKRVAAGEMVNNFLGDAAITNGYVLAIVRKQGTGVELYSLNTGKPVFRARLVLATSVGIEGVALTENGRSAVGLEVSWKPPHPASSSPNERKHSEWRGAVRFRLPKGEQFIESQALADAATLRVECPSRFAVLPDFFAADILFDAHKVPLDRVELPSENFLLHFTGKQDAIVMGVFENRAQDVRVLLAGKGDQRAITGSEIDFGKKGSKIWVAVLETAGIWHTLDVGAADVKKVLPLLWKMPFIAQWRVDFTRQDGLTDSWDMLLTDKEGNGYIKPTWLASDGRLAAATRTATGEVDRDAYKPGGPASDRLGPDRHRWTTVLGRVQYPCWSDRQGNGFLQPLENKRLRFDGAVVIYPLTRLADTPVASYTPVDIVRNTLGVGPCQHLLDVEGQKQEHVGRATCHVRTLLNEVYGKGLQKEKQKEIENYLGDAQDFVTHIRNRVLAYGAFAKELRTYLREQRAAHPELHEPLDSLEQLAGEIDARVEPHVQAILQHPTLKAIVARVVEQKAEPTPPVLAAELNRDFKANGLLGYEGRDWEARLKKEYTDPLTTIGGNQDEMVGECRWVVKALRQKACIFMATDPRMAPIAAEIRVRTQKMLRGGAAYEGARH
jgi:hypothetical protein